MAVVQKHSPQTRKCVQKILGVLEQSRDIMKNAIDDDANHHEYHEECLQEVMH